MYESIYNKKKMIFFLYNQIGSTEIYFGSNSMNSLIGQFQALWIPQEEINWEAFDEQLEKLFGRQSYETGGRGNCQFCVIAFVLNQYQVYKDHTRVRQEVCDEMKKNSHLYQGFVPMNGEDAGMSYAARVEQLRADGEWGGHVTLQAACNVYGLSLTVFRPNASPMYVQPNTRSTNTSPCKRGYIAIMPEIHYRATLPVETGTGAIKPEAVVSVPSSTLVDWTCTQCTLVNRRGAFKCEACSAWKCANCTAVNREGTAKCFVCSVDPPTA